MIIFNKTIYIAKKIVWLFFFVLLISAYYNCGQNLFKDSCIIFNMNTSSIKITIHNYNIYFVPLCRLMILIYTCVHTIHAYIHVYKILGILFASNHEPLFGKVTRL